MTTINDGKSLKNALNNYSYFFIKSWNNTNCLLKTVVAMKVEFVFHTTHNFLNFEIWRQKHYPGWTFSQKKTIFPGNVYFWLTHCKVTSARWESHSVSSPNPNPQIAPQSQFCFQAVLSDKVDGCCSWNWYHLENSNHFLNWHLHKNRISWLLRAFVNYFRMRSLLKQGYFILNRKTIFENGQNKHP